MIKRKLVTLVTTEVFTPYKAGEVFSIEEELAEKLLKPDRTRDEYGRQRYPKVKCRPFNSLTDGDTLLSNKSLNLSQHNSLLKKLHPDWPTEQAQLSEFESDVTHLLEKSEEDNEVEEVRRGRGRPPKTV